MTSKSIMTSAARSGAFGTAASTLALGLGAFAEGRGAAQPLNATSHLLHGEKAADPRGLSGAYTGIGVGTHAVATLLWAVAFEASPSIRPVREPFRICGRASAIGVLAAIVDYTMTPKRFTPGWELVLSKSSMAAVYAAMASGFAAAALGSRR